MGGCRNDGVPKPENHCQNGRGDICLAGWQDGICCPEESCDIDDTIRYAEIEKEVGSNAKLRGCATTKQESSDE